MENEKDSLTRRDFLQASACSLGACALGGGTLVAGAGDSVVLVVSPGDLTAAAPVQWALEELRREIARRNTAVQQVEAVERVPREASVVVVVSAGAGPVAGPLLQRAGVAAPAAAESLALVPSTVRGRPAVLACGHDARGLMYAVLELADRVEHATDPVAALRLAKPVAERPHNAVRAIGRPFASDVEDKPWFDDRGFWPPYFAMLARERVNRFHFCLGLGYDTLKNVADSYLLFAYPFLLSVPGYDVRAANLPDVERDRNLETLRFISREAARHGLDFQLGLWTHGCVWDESPAVNYTIEGLTPATQAAYCRDALAAVLRACPDVTGVTLRTHYESGVREGSYGFWKTIFEGVPRSGRTLEIELHAKGLDRRMIEGALAQGVPVRVSPKYCAEHTGLPYHQAAIREFELPHSDVDPASFSALSFGSRNHTRYGYADFLEEGRPYGVFFRVFPGTHKFLLWGDPVTTAAQARSFRFCGSEGAELFEPLSFKGRRGSGRAGGRCGYADASLNPRRDWEKYRYTYRLWGRLLYDPDADPSAWRRLLRTQYGGEAAAMEAALGPATRILPLVTSAHLPSAAQDAFSPECYTNQSITDPKAPTPYWDTPAPPVFGTVSPLDPELFSTVAECADRLLAGRRGAKYTPIEAAQWLEDLAASASSRLAEARGRRRRSRGARVDPGFTRAAIDIRLQAGIGRFFAAKLRSGVLYAIHEKAGERLALEEATRLYRQARDGWARLAAEAGAVYAADIPFGPLPHQRGHWSDRLAAIDLDVAGMAKKLEALAPGGAPSALVKAAIGYALGRPTRPPVTCRHAVPAGFARGSAVALALAVQQAALSSVRLHYRHVNQAERYQVADMRVEGGAYRATIPAAYTNSVYPLQYYFSFEGTAGDSWLHPGLGADLTGTPYFVIRQQP